MPKKKGGSSSGKKWKRRFVLLCVGAVVVLLIVARNQHATPSATASPSNPAATASATLRPRLGLDVQRAPVCLGDMGAQEYYVRVRVVNTGNVTETMHFTVQPGYAIRPEWVKMGGDVSLDPQKSQVVQGSLFLPTGVQPGVVNGQILVTASAPQVPGQVLAATVTMRGRVGNGIPPCY